MEQKMSKNVNKLSQDEINKIEAEILRLEESLKLVRGTPCEVWCRVTGFFRPVSAFNPGKKSEFDERVNFIVDK